MQLQQLRSGQCAGPRCAAAPARQHVRSREASFARRVANSDTSLATAAGAGTAIDDGPSTSGGSSYAPPDVPLTGKLARFSARKHTTKPVREASRALAAYMALPASQYSVLDARKVERLDESTFRCHVGRLGFFGFSVEPVITVSVVVEERGCTIQLLSAKLQGSDVVQDINSKFAASMTNVVRWAATGEDGVKEISSDTAIAVTVQVPGWFSVVPVGSIEAAGSSVMQTTLNLMVPRFLEQLEKDYARWAAGDESRQPVGDL